MGRRAPWCQFHLGLFTDSSGQQWKKATPETLWHSQPCWAWQDQHHKQHSDTTAPCHWNGARTAQHTREYFCRDVAQGLDSMTLRVFYSQTDCVTSVCCFPTGHRAFPGLPSQGTTPGNNQLPACQAKSWTLHHQLICRTGWQKEHFLAQGEGQVGSYTWGLWWCSRRGKLAPGAWCVHPQLCFVVTSTWSP